MIHLFEGDTANDVWQQAAAKLTDPSVRCQPGRGGSTRELLHTVFSIRDPRQRWVVAREPALNPVFAIAEVVWLLNGRNDSAFLNYWNSQLPAYAGSGQEYHGAYGYRLRRHFGLDQLQRAYIALDHDQNSRQVVLQIWDPIRDLPTQTGQPASPDVPCSTTALLKIRDNRLEWMQVVRSNDIFRGVPYNFIQFTTLQEIMAGWLGVGLGSYHHLSDSLHLYVTDADHMTVANKMPAEANSDSLCLPFADSDRALSLLCERIEAFIQPVCTMSALRDGTADGELPTAFQNLLLIVGAEAARRRGWRGQSQQLADRCENAALIQVWERWLDRVSASAGPNARANAANR